MKFIIGLLFLSFLYAAYGIYVSHFSLNIMPTVLRPSPPEGFYDYKGITNVHTRLNKGSGTHQQVIGEAESEGFDFLFFTDLNIFKKNKQINGYQGRLLVFAAGTYNYLNTLLLHYRPHQKPEHRNPSDAQLFFTEFLSKKQKEHKEDKEDFVVLAHPFRKNYQWHGPFPEALKAIEVLNLKSVWEASLSQSKLSFVWSLLIYFFNPKYALIRLYLEPEKEIQLWDKLNEKQKVVALAGHNSTAKALPWTGFKVNVPSYRSTFSFISNHVLLKSELTGSSHQDQERIFQALKKGQFYFSLDFLENPKGFIAYATQDGKKHLMGSQLAFSEEKPVTLFVQLPETPRVPYEIVVIKDGQPHKVFNQRQIHFRIKKSGVYRVIVRVMPDFPLPDGKRWITWIYTNPFYIKNQ